MLRQNEVTSGFAVAEALNARGVIATFRSGTVLGEVASATRLQFNDETYNWDNGASSLLTGMAEAKDTTGKFVHGEKLEQALLLASRTIQDQLIFARNTVNPIIERIVNSIETKEADRGGESALRPEIVPRFYADLWSNNSWIATVNRFEDVQASRCMLRERLGDPLGEDLKTWVMTGAAALDKDIEAMLVNKPEGWLWNVYRGVFQGATDILFEYDMVGTSDATGWFFSNSRRSVDEAAAAYLLGRGILREAPQWLTERMKEDMAGIINAAGLRCMRAIQHREIDMKQGQLVFSFGIYGGPNGARVGQVFVNGDTYNAFLEKGGSPELLMGSAYGPQLRKAEEILNARQDLENRYRAHEARIEEMYSTERLARFTEYVRIELINEMRQIPEEALHCSREEMVAKIRQWAGDLRMKDTNELWEFVRAAVCKIFFPHTNAYTVLTRYDDVHTRMADADQRVVGFYAALELLSEWAFEAMEFTLVK